MARHPNAALGRLGKIPFWTIPSRQSTKRRKGGEGPCPRGSNAPALCRASLRRARRALNARMHTYIFVAYTDHAHQRFAKVSDQRGAVPQCANQRGHDKAQAVRRQYTSCARNNIFAARQAGIKRRGLRRARMSALAWPNRRRAQGKHGRPRQTRSKIIGTCDESFSSMELGRGARIGAPSAPPSPKTRPKDSYVLTGQREYNEQMLKEVAGAIRELPR